MKISLIVTTYDWPEALRLSIVVHCKKLQEYA